MEAAAVVNCLTPVRGLSEFRPRIMVNELTRLVICTSRREAPRKSEPAMEFADRFLKCLECGAEFVFSSGEQAFFSEKQFTNDPKRCKRCRGRDGSRRSPRPETYVTCAECGADTTVPFKPTQGRPVLCRACFQKVRSATQMPSTIAPERTAQAKQRPLKSVIPFRQSKMEP